MGAVLACLPCMACSALSSAATAAVSLAGCGCTGNSAVDIPTDLMVGKLRSLSLVIGSIILGLLTQYYWADDAARYLSAWSGSCGDSSSCIGNHAIYRTSFIDSVFFSLMMVGSAFSGYFNNRYWGPKLLLWSGLTLAAIFMPNHVFGDGGYVWVARFGAFLFTILQQLVLIDIAYKWNDTWVAKAESEPELGGTVLGLLVTACVLIYGGSLVSVGFMFHFFKGCPANNAILSLTLVLSTLATGLQLSGEEGNLLASAIVTAYSVYLSFTALSKGPHEECNPFVGDENVTGKVMGLLLTCISLVWICAKASTSVTKLLGGETPEVMSPGRAQPFITSDSNEDGGPQEDLDDGGEGWRFNLVLVLICMYFGMSLTNWGVHTEEDGTNPKHGAAAMWLTVSGQWVCLLLYGWTVVAPRLFPDRDFS
ncbi:unnamed protein product [Chrysoparadoxa australica]